ncbi:MAG: DUF1491 family protein [Rhizobiaceae bacterium]|nr:DUF1491 family protein [Rhizobiaceae bacterium]
MRVTSELFSSALVRRVFADGGFAAVQRRGAAEAGAIFIRQRFRDGLETLYGPAPQSAFDADDDDRRFERRAERADAGICDDIIAREARFDPDLWVVEVEVDDISGLMAVTES